MHGILSGMDTGHYANDGDLIAACSRQEPVAWDAFVKKYSRLMRIAIEKRARRCGPGLSRQDTDDILQETLASIWRDGKLSSINAAESLPYWLAVIAGNSAADRMRKAARETRNEILMSREDDDREDPIASRVSGGNDPSEELSRTELSKRIDEAMEGLGPHEKLSAKLHFIYGKKHEEIAGMIGISRNTVASHIKRSRVKLRAALMDFLAFFATFLPVFTSYIIGG